MNSGSRGFKTAYYQLFPSYEKELERWLGSAGSVLDVGCGSDSPIQSFSRNIDSTGVDGHAPSIERSRAKGIHRQYLQIELEKLAEAVPAKSFDAVCALDLIEHLEKDRALQLIHTMEGIARKRIVIVTPNGFLPQGEFDQNPFQRHVSGWEVEEMRDLGYTVHGIRGLKPLRGEFADFTVRPRLLGRILSDSTQWVVRSRPSLAFQLLCVKDLPG